MTDQQTEKPARRAPAIIQIPIPPHAKPQVCRSEKCGMRVYWAEHPRTKKMHITSVNQLVDPACIEPTSTTWGVGVSHWNDCRDRERFTKKPANKRAEVKR